MMQQWDEGKGNFVSKAVATLTITENFLIMLNSEKKNKYCIIKSEQVNIIRKIGKKVLISDGVQTGCIAFNESLLIKSQVFFEENFINPI